MLMRIVVGWIIYQMGAPWWIWVCLSVSVLFEFQSIPFWFRLIRADRDGKFR